MDVYKQQSRYSDPGRHAALLDDLPKDLPSLAAVVRNLIVHFRAAGIEFTGGRLAEVDSRWVERILDVDQSRHPVPLAEPREPAQRVVGCCRDFALLTVAALRHQGTAARTRIGFAGYFLPDFHCDHVIAEYWDGRRWVWADAQLEPGPQWSFDPLDLPRPVFETAAQVWLRFRAGETDCANYGVAPDMPVLRGSWFVRKYVLQELAHLHRDETLLWDEWDRMSCPDEVIDEVAHALMTGDGDGLHEPVTRVRSHSPTGVVRDVEL